MIAVLTGMDTYPARSLKLMLESVGYDVYMLSDQAMNRIPGYNGGAPAKLLENMGYRPAEIPFVEETALETCDLYVDMKRKDADDIIKAYPRLKGRTICYVINGGWDDYEDYCDYYPTITNNFWIKGAYHVWSPIEWDITPKDTVGDEPPIGLLHNARNWGFNKIMDEVIDKTGLRVFGSYGSPMGILPNDKVEEYLKRTSCFVHLKASDCPGWALFEAMATATPLVITEFFVKRMGFEDMYIDGKTCLMWGQGSFELKDDKNIVEYIDQNADRMVEQIADCVEKLKDPEYNYYIGHQGYKKWKELTKWTPEKRDKLYDYLQSTTQSAI